MQRRCGGELRRFVRLSPSRDRTGNPRRAATRSPHRDVPVGWKGGELLERPDFPLTPRPLFGLPGSEPRDLGNARVERIEPVRHTYSLQALLRGKASSEPHVRRARHGNAQRTIGLPRVVVRDSFEGANAQEPTISRSPAMSTRLIISPLRDSSPSAAPLQYPLLTPSPHSLQGLAHTG
jgi:hypothetical protein